MKYEIHELALILPELYGKDLEEFTEDIKLNGLIDPVVLHENKVLEGRNRYKVCLTLGIECRFVNLPEGVNPLRYVVSKNLKRRHLNETQRAFLGAKFANMEAHRPNRITSPKGEVNLISNVEAAKLVDVSKRQLEKAKRILNSGNTELIEAAEQEKISLTKADSLLPKVTKRRPSNLSFLKRDGFKMIDGKFVLPPDVSVMETTDRRKVEISGSSALKDVQNYRLWETYRKNKIRNKVLNLLMKEFDLFPAKEEISLYYKMIEMLSADLLRFVESQKQIAKYDNITITNQSTKTDPRS